MSHIGFSELILLFIIGLLILGPDRLPRVASEIGRWVGRARRTANQLRYQLEREITVAEQEKAREQKQKPAARPDATAKPSTATEAGSRTTADSATPPASETPTPTPTPTATPTPTPAPATDAADSNETIRQP